MPKQTITIPLSQPREVFFLCAYLHGPAAAEYGLRDIMPAEPIDSASPSAPYRLQKSGAHVTCAALASATGISSVTALAVWRSWKPHSTHPRPNRTDRHSARYIGAPVISFCRISSNPRRPFRPSVSVVTTFGLRHFWSSLISVITHLERIT